MRRPVIDAPMTRRGVIRAGLSAAIILGATPAWAAKAQPADRTLCLHCLNTDEKLNAVYWSRGHYVAESLKAINHLLRDFRTDDVHAIDVKLLDLLARLRRRLGGTKPIEVICGYRSPRTNTLLAERHAGVAAHSLHMQGKAIDIRLADRRLRDLQQAAIALHRGGVGFYPQSDFVHVDIGPVRRW